MGTVVKLPNITTEAIESLEANESAASRQSNFNPKNYLDVKLAEGQSKKTLTIRLLPMDLQTGSPFVKVHFHRVKVNPELVPKGSKPYKAYLCLQKNKDIDHEKFGTRCPFCEQNKLAYEKYQNETDPVQKKFWKEVSLQNLSNEAVIVRCIERGKEDEGVKFWKFNLRSDNKDPYHTILDLYNQRKAEGERKGKVVNILDLFNGKDLNITFNGGTPVPPPTIVDDGEYSPLSESEEQMKEWIYDAKRWQDVFTPKNYDYLSLVSEMKVPWYDRSAGKWIDKEEYDSKYAKNEAADDQKVLVGNQNWEHHDDSVTVAASDPTEIEGYDDSEDDLPF